MTAYRPGNPCGRAMLAFAMPGAFTRSEVEAIAALARLELNQQEIELFGRQLGDILTYAEEVQRIDTTGVPPTASVSRSVDTATAAGQEREDVAVPGLDLEAALANAPDPSDQAGAKAFYRVPRVIG